MTEPVSAYGATDSIWVEHRRRSRRRRRRARRAPGRSTRWLKTSWAGSVPAMIVGPHEEALAVVGRAAGDDVSASSSLARSSTPESLENARSSMTAPMKFDRSVTSPIVSDSVVGDQLVAQSAVPDAARHVGARGGRALLALVLEGAADQRGAQHAPGRPRGGRRRSPCRRSRRRSAGSRGSESMFSPTVRHRCWKIAGGAGEVDAGQVAGRPARPRRRRCRRR